MCANNFAEGQAGVNFYLNYFEHILATPIGRWQMADRRWQTPLITGVLCGQAVSPAAASQHFSAARGSGRHRFVTIFIRQDAQT